MAPIPPLRRLLTNEKASSSPLRMRRATLPKWASFGEEDARMAVEVVNPPRGHSPIRLGFQPFLVQSPEPVDGLGVIPPLGAPVLIL